MNVQTRILGLVLALTLCLSTAAWAAPVKLIALTLDDGPSTEYTPHILDVLKERGAKATFFVLGKWLGPDKPFVLEREFAEGHQVGSHTYHHVKLTTLTDEQIRTELTSLAAAVNEMAGQKQETYLLRPPFGDCDERVLSVVDVPVIHWSIDAARGRQVPGEQMADYIVQRAFDGAIILMHDTTEYNAVAIPLLIDALQAQGYEFVTVNELFRLKGVTPENGKLYYKVEGLDPLVYDEAKLQEHWAWSFISYLEEHGIMTGDEAGFHPNHPLTRAMAVTVLWCAAHSPVSGHNPGFRDVPYQGAWYSVPVDWASENGIVKGTSDTTFSPDALITREEFYSILARYAHMVGVVAPALAEIPTFGDDRRIQDWAEDDVTYLRALGFRSDYDVELFRPGVEITRAETAELLTWYLKNEDSMSTELD
ncbi:MAG: hypothetical protein EOM52_10420 [Clostridia bacterium]|nr:hypothetical protein [Clostridia bacterium]